MEGRANYAVIGASIVVAALLAAIFTIWLGGFNPNRQYEHFEIGFLGPVRGLQQASEVRFNGIKVGEVTSLRIDPEAPTKRVIAGVKVDGALPISVSTIARLELNPLTNVALIQLSGGDPNAPRLKGVNGRPPRLEGQSPQFDNLVLSGEDLLRNSNEVILSVRRLLTPENVRRLSRTLANLERASTRLAAADGLLDNANLAAKNLSSAGASVTQLAENGNEAAVEAKAAIIEARKAAESFRNLTDASAVTAEDASAAMPQFTASARELQFLAAKLETIADELDRNRASYLAGRSRPTRELPQ
jgi:phospholipid/cholesterol/gamma-HCH transport system substrate-binding protein